VLPEQLSIPSTRPSTPCSLSAAALLERAFQQDDFLSCASLLMLPISQKQTIMPQ